MAQYRLLGSERVLDAIRDLDDDDLRTRVLDTIDQILEEPYPQDPPTRALAILPYKDPTCANCYTIAVGRALILYQIYVDYPMVRLLNLMISE